MDCIGVLGISFKTADLSLREAIARSAEKLTFFHHPAVLLSTCNRTEIYFCACDLAKAHSELLQFLRAQIEEPFEHRMYSYFGTECFVHLCKVTAGLDSAIFAETEIQRQVKVAYAKAAEKSVLPKCMHYSFQKALKVGKSARNRFPIKAPMLYSMLWRQETWQGKKILLVGYSEINRGFASFLVHKGIHRFAFCTQCPDAVKMEGVEVFDRSILSNWQQFDVIVTASKSDRYLIFGNAKQHHVIFDLSVPRNVDPSIGQVARLYNMDQMIGSVDLLEECEPYVREQAIRLSMLYKAKSLRIQQNIGIGQRP